MAAELQVKRMPDILGTWWLGGLLLALGLGLTGYAVLRPPHTILVGVVRKRVYAYPPYELSTDRDRVHALLLEPLCPQPPAVVEVGTPVRAVGACTKPDPTTGAVTVTLRTGLELGGRDVDASDVLAAVQSWDSERKERAAARGGAPAWWADTPVAQGDKLTFTPAPDTSGGAMRAVLADIPVAVLDETTGCLLGTGLWREVDCLKEASEVNDHPAFDALPAGLRTSGAVTDLVALERVRELGLVRSRIVMVGLDYEDVAPSACGPQDAHVASQSHADKSETLACVVERALSAATGERLDLLRGFEGDQVERIRRLRAAKGNPTDKQWDLVSQKGPRVTWAVARPSLDEKNRVALLNAVREVADDAAFYNDVDGPPARSLLPPIFSPVAFTRSGDTAPLEQDLPAPTPPSEGCPAVSRPDHAILTHTFWEPVASRLHRLLTAKGLDLDLVIVPVTVERKCRDAGAYALSVMSVSATAQSHPANFLYPHISIWLSSEKGGPVEDALALAAAELPSGEVPADDLADLLRRLDNFIVPLNSPPTWYAVHRNLLGWDLDSGRLDPDTAGLRDIRFATAHRWGLSILVLGVLGLVTTALVRRERTRQRALLARDISAFHHDLSSPLTAILNEADHIDKVLLPRVPGGDPLADELRKVARIVDIEAGLAHLLVDDVKLAVDPKQVVMFDSGRGCVLADEVLPKELDRLRERASREGLPRSIESTANPPRAPLAIGPRAAQRVVQNLLDNAFKYRKQGNPLRVEVTLEAMDDGHRLSVLDWGIGFDKSLAPEAFFALRQRGQRPEDQAVQGHGVGLATVARLVEAVGGSVTLVHYENPSVVAVWLPLAAARRSRR
jgi:signal transduction histidine kinase